MNKMGMSVFPKYIEKAIDEKLKRKLRLDGHNISFPCPTTCQVRIVRQGQTYGCSFAYSQHGGYQGAIEAAMQFTVEKRKELEDKRIDQGPYHNIKMVAAKKGRRNTVDYSHIVTYTKVDGKRAAKTFWHGHKLPTPGQWLHAQHTALFFLSEQKRIKEQFGTDINTTRFKLWRSVRLYWDSEPLDYHSI